MAAASTNSRATRKVRRARRAALSIEVPTGVGQLSTAATRKIKDQPPRGMERKKWQEEAYGHVDFIGEVGYVTGQIADTVSRAELVVLERDLETGAVIVPEKDSEGNDIIDGDRATVEKALLALRGPGGDHRTIVRAIAEADFVAGEGHLLGLPLDKEDQIAWEFLSIFEITEDKTTNKKTRKRHAERVGTGAAAEQNEELDNDAYISRYHRRDPRHSGDATSSLRRVAAACREVVLLTQLVEATIKSHIPAGILLVADELSLPLGAEDETVDDDEEIDPLLEVLTEHLSAPIEDRQSAASLVPLLLNAPSEVLDKALKLVKLDAERMDPERIINLRENALGRIATGLDVPPEIMTGMASLNHWTGATVSKDFIEKHAIPPGDRVAQFLTIAYLRRVLMDLEGWDEARAERWEFDLDFTALLSRADAASSADSLWKDRVLSDDARLKAHGFDPDKDKPKDDERFRRYIEAIALASSVTNKPFLAALGLTEETLIEMGMEPDAAAALLSPSTEGTSTPGDGDSEDPPEAGEPGADEDAINRAEADTVPGGTETPVTTSPDQLALARVHERIRVAASERLTWTVERAAGLAIQRIPKDSIDTRDRCRALPKLEVLPAIPAADWKEMGVTQGRLVDRPWLKFQGLAVSWLRDHFETRMGMTHYTADEVAHRIVSELVTLLDETYETAFKRPLERCSDGLYFPAGIVETTTARHLELVTGRR